MRTNQRGFSLIETLVALLMVSLAAMLLVRASAANALALSQVIKRSSAVRLVSEFSAWTHRDGHLALGMPLDEAFAGSGQHATSCDLGDCNAGQGAWHYLSRWRERLSVAIPDAQVRICIDQPPQAGLVAWSCDPHGPTWVMKLRWPSGSIAVPPLVVELAQAA